MTDRATELATLAVRRHEATGMPLEQSIAAAIRQAISEIGADLHMDMVGTVVTPSEIDRQLGLGKGTAYSRLNKAVFQGTAKKERRGRYRILGGTAELMAPAHPGVRSEIAARRAG